MYLCRSKYLQIHLVHTIALQKLTMGSCITKPMVVPEATLAISSVEPTEEEVTELMNMIADEIRLEEENEEKKKLCKLKSI